MRTKNYGRKKVARDWQASCVQFPKLFHNQRYKAWEPWPGEEKTLEMMSEVFQWKYTTQIN